MVTEDKDAERAKQIESHRRQYVKLIDREIKTRGLPAVLADILVGPQEYKNKLHYARPDNHLRDNGVKIKRKTQK